MNYIIGKLPEFKNEQEKPSSELSWDLEKELLGLPPNLTKERCIRGATEAMKYEFMVDPFIDDSICEFTSLKIK